MSFHGLEIGSTGPLEPQSPFQDRSVEQGFQGTLIDADIESRVALLSLGTFGLFELLGGFDQTDTGRRIAIRQLETGAVGLFEGVFLTRIRDKRWIVLSIGSRSLPDGLDPHMDGTANGLMTVTDLSHGVGCLLLVGTNSTTTLGRLCSINLEEHSFAHTRSAYTSLAGVRALILRWDHEHAPAYFICVPRSTSRYVRQAIMDELSEVDIVGHDTSGNLLSWPQGWKTPAGT